MSEKIGGNEGDPKPRRRIGLVSKEEALNHEVIPADQGSFEYKEYGFEETITRDDEPFLEGLVHPALIANWSWIK